MNFSRSCARSTVRTHARPTNRGATTPRTPPAPSVAPRVDARLGRLTSAAPSWPAHRPDRRGRPPPRRPQLARQADAPHWARSRARCARLRSVADAYCRLRPAIGLGHGNKNVTIAPTANSTPGPRGFAASSRVPYVSLRYQRGRRDGCAANRTRRGRAGHRPARTPQRHHNGFARRECYGVIR